METTFSFTGEAIHTLDDKGRLALPGKIRDELLKSEKPEEVVAYADPAGDGCVTLYPHERWQEIELWVKNNVPANKRKVVSRDLGRNSMRLAMDKAGRINLSPKHREVAGLEREVLLLGSLGTIELWGKDRLDGQMIQDKDLVLDIKQGYDIPM